MRNDTESFTYQRARVVAAELEALHHRVEARVLYRYGAGAYAVVASGPYDWQAETLLDSEYAYGNFRNLRGDSWKRAPSRDTEAVADRREQLANVRRLAGEEAGE